MKHDLFEDFPTADFSTWEKQVQKELKGEDAGSLNWLNENGINLPPYYSREQVKTNYLPAFTHADWKVCVKHSGPPEELNKKFLRDLNHGAEGLVFSPRKGDIEKCLKNVRLELINLQVKMSAEVADEFLNFLNAHYKGKNLHISLFPEKISNETELMDWQKVQRSFAHFPGVLTTAVDAVELTSENALPYYELALAFTQLLEQLSRTEAVGNQPVVVRSSCDTDFFIQIAKLRAYRRIWKLISKEYGMSNSLYLCVESDLNSLSLSDSHNNLLRNTLSGMAAVMGGCNELAILPYDVLLNGDSSFSSRMAMNQQFIFKHESYLDKMGDVACGSYYIESLTDFLCERALKAIQDIEKKGGYFKVLASGEIAQMLKEKTAMKVSSLQDGKTLRIGVNKFRNDKENIPISEEQLIYFQKLSPHHPLLAYELKQLQKV